MVYRDAARIEQRVVGILAALISAISFERKSYVRHRCGIGGAMYADFRQVDVKFL